MEKLKNNAEMEKICKNAGFISESELEELSVNDDVNGGTWATSAAVVSAATAVSALFTVTSACTKSCK